MISSVFLPPAKSNFLSVPISFLGFFAPSKIKFPISLDYQVDMVIELSGKSNRGETDYFLHEMWIKKSRFQNAALGWHQYKIRNSGIEVFPSVHFQVHRQFYMDSQLLTSQLSISSNYKSAHKNEQKSTETGKGKEFCGSILEFALGGIVPGSITAFLGPRGTFKTTLTMDFLIAGQRVNQDPGLLVSLIDNRDTLISSANCPRKEIRKTSGENGWLCQCCDPAQKKGKCLSDIYLFHQRPGFITPAEFIYYLQQRIRVDDRKTDHNARLAFWDLTQLDYRFPLFVQDPVFLPGLMDMLKSKHRERKISSVIMGSANSHLTSALSATADNVIFCWRDWLGRGKKRTKASLKPNDEREEFLMMYVDRSEGSLGSEGKNLFRFKVINDHITPFRFEGNTEPLISIKSQVIYSDASTAGRNSSNRDHHFKIRKKDFDTWLERPAEENPMQKARKHYSVDVQDALEEYTFAKEHYAYIIKLQGFG